MKEVSVDKYNALINLQKENGTNYSEHLKGLKLTCNWTHAYYREYHDCEVKYVPWIPQVARFPATYESIAHYFH